ncbi:helix-turn-helix domain-containing protein [Pseudoflavonifractor phocaeensis]|uniref:helix-turn-helix domain-containing protein n=1 Tax=Pseudoflavonifractor phocaeensis TaxID=1870988 RepID=UPI0019591E93|nr:helix-turn-helix transcriptional regulator [Pseudoflavonifractor phocaeensis]MBM6886923.1 helix-turn-helix transcriptional regulator [Pseudoflavonifractor phocaeensis]
MKKVHLPTSEQSSKGSERQKNNQDLIELGKNIQRCREVAGMTQKKLGMEIDADKAQISRYESGQAAMKVDRLFQIAEVLQVPVEELCPKWLRGRGRISPQWYRLVGMIEKLPEEKREVLFQAAEAMAIGFYRVR